MKPGRNSSLQSKDNWDDHWKKYSDSASENPAQKYRQKLILGELERLHHTGFLKIMDIGCGQGDLLLAIQNRFPNDELIGIELSREGVHIAKEKSGLAEIFQVDVINYKNELMQFHEWADVIVCTEVLEHVDDPVLFLKVVFLFLKQKGIAIVTVPGGPMSNFDQSIGHRQHFNTISLLPLFHNNNIEKIIIYHAGFPWHTIYRLIVISRGNKLAADVSKKLSWTAVLMMRIFSFLFNFNLKDCRWGWQNVIVAWKE